MGEVAVRVATSEDVPGILETLRASLGETPVLRRTPELWAWKHLDNPFGKSLVLVASSGGRIAGVRAMARWELLTPSGVLLSCVRAVDTATHPDFMRQGLFRHLTLTSLDAARAQGVHLVFNTPNAKSAPGYIQMGWKQVTRLGVLIRPRLGRAVAPGHETPPSIREIAPGLAPIGEMPLDTASRPPRGLRTPRRPDYLQWRFQSHPTAQYGWLGDRSGSGGVVARASSRGPRSEMIISDFVGLATPSTVRHAARCSRARYMAGWFSPNTPERRAAMGGGMIPAPIRTLRLVALPLTDLDIDVHDPRSWDLSTADLELL